MPVKISFPENLKSREQKKFRDSLYEIKIVFSPYCQVKTFSAGERGWY